METESETRAREHFERVTADHQMRIIHDDDLYRELLFASPGTFMYSFTIVTWPNHLAINGDLDSGYTFSHIRGMIYFFQSDTAPINPHYWAEKITNRAAQEATREYSQRAMEARVTQALIDMADSEEMSCKVLTELWNQHVRNEMADMSTESDARRTIERFSYGNRCFPDVWEWGLRDWTHSYLLCCHAIRFAVETYTKSKQELKDV